MNELRDLPSVDLLLQSAAGLAWQDEYGRSLTLLAVRSILDEIRIQFNITHQIPDVNKLEKRIDKELQKLAMVSLMPVINASGVILHTNLGRAPLCKSALEAIQRISSGYSNLEYDLQKGRRGSRLSHAEEQLKQLTGAEGALVVNNNAAAVLLILSALARRRAVVIARSQLIEIGGGFRIPDVMKQSGARLVEVGTTNRVHSSDYIEAIETENPALVLRAHRSNFRIIGFTSEPDLGEIVELSHQAGIPIVDDLGSGTLLDTRQFGLVHEPTVQETLKSEVDLVCFSGDKLLGGPQAGIIVGKLKYIEKIKKHPLARAVRADKLCLAALSATLSHYQREQAVQHIPVWQMIAVNTEALQQRALSWAEDLDQGQIQKGESTIGGGSLPGETLPTYNLVLKVPKPSKTVEILRRTSPAIIVRVENDQILLDPRTVLPEQDPILIKNLSEALQAK